MSTKSSNASNDAAENQELSCCVCYEPLDLKRQKDVQSFISSVFDAINRKNESSSSSPLSSSSSSSHSSPSAHFNHSSHSSSTLAASSSSTSSSPSASPPHEICVNVGERQQQHQQHQQQQNNRQQPSRVGVPSFSVTSLLADFTAEAMRTTLPTTSSSTPPANENGRFPTTSLTGVDVLSLENVSPSHSSSPPSHSSSLSPSSSLAFTTPLRPSGTRATLPITNEQESSKNKQLFGVAVCNREPELHMMCEKCALQFVRHSVNSQCPMCKSELNPAIRMCHRYWQMHKQTQYLCVRQESTKQLLQTRIRAIRDGFARRFEQQYYVKESAKPNFDFELRVSSCGSARGETQMSWQRKENGRNLQTTMSGVIRAHENIEPNEWKRLIEHTMGITIESNADLIKSVFIEQCNSVCDEIPFLLRWPRENLDEEMATDAIIARAMAASDFGSSGVAANNTTTSAANFGVGGVGGGRSTSASNSAPQNSHTHSTINEELRGLRPFRPEQTFAPGGTTEREAPSRETTEQFVSASPPPPPPPPHSLQQQFQQQSSMSFVQQYPILESFANIQPTSVPAPPRSSPAMQSFYRSSYR